MTSKLSFPEPKHPTESPHLLELERDELIRSHLGLVHHLARQMVRSLGGAVELEDLVSYGVVGLISAVDRFEAERGLSFSTFASPRIRGAILDEIRKQDYMPRTLRKKERTLSRTRDLLEHQLNRTPTDQELADCVGIPLTTLWQWEADVEHGRQVRISSGGTEEDSDTASILSVDLIPDENANRIEHTLTREREIEYLRESIMDLKEQERKVLALYYFENLTLGQIAEIIGVSESRISQIRAKTIIKLKESMGKLLPPKEGK